MSPLRAPRLAIATLSLALSAHAMAAESVTLAYGWPAGLDVAVSFEGERIRQLAGRAHRSAMRGSYRLTSSETAGGLLLTQSDFEMEPADDAPPEGPQRELQSMLTRVAGALPQTVVGSDGRIVRFDGTQAMIAQFRDAFSRIAATLPAEARPGFEQMISQVLTPEIIERRMTENWNRDVGSWAGATLEQGERYRLEAHEPVALLGNTAVPIEVHFEYLGPAACSDAPAAPRCASLRLTSRVQSEKVGEALAAFMRRFTGAGQAVPDIRDMSVDTTVSLITEPATLLPHRITVEKSTVLSVARDGQTQRSEQTQRQLFRYRYR